MPQIDRPEETVFYNGQHVPKNHFRTYIFNVNGEKKLVESWKDYEFHIDTGVWFKSIDELPKTEKRKYTKKRSEEMTHQTQESEQEYTGDDLGYEVETNTGD